jgi:hypothetical protein
MRALPLGLLVVIGGCAAADAGDRDTDVVDDTDLSSTAADPTCSEAYAVPGAFGSEADVPVDAHQDVFGGTESLGGDGSLTIGPDPVHVHLGWPGRDTSRSISFVWQTDTGTLASVVELAEGADLSGQVTRHEGVSFAFGGTTTYRVHELKLCGELRPGTTYSYRVGGEGHWSEVRTFTTPGAPGTFDTFTVVAAGDSRGSYEQWSTLMQRAAAEDPDFFVFTGDMVAVGGNQLEWHAWWEALEGIVDEAVLVPAHGNHEFLAANYFAQFSLPGNEQWFAVDYGSATFVSLNDTVPQDGTLIAGEEADFLREALSTGEAGWKVAMHHQTMVTASDGHDPNDVAYAAWGPILEAGGADLVLAGHNHLYERSKPIAGGEAVADGAGPVYLVTGGAGAPLYQDITADADRLALNAAHAEVEHYVVLTFSPEGVHGVTKDLSGNVLDTFDVVDR